MSLNSIFQFLVPKDKTFYPLFEQAAGKIKLLSETLHEAVNLPANDREKSLKEVEEIVELMININKAKLNIFNIIFFNT